MIVINLLPYPPYAFANFLHFQVAIPYEKIYNNGDRVEIINNGQLEIRLYNKGRNPSVRLRATNYNTWINAEMWLHGSCADVTSGMCGNWNKNPHDDLTGGSGNSLGTLHQEFDENCPAPPPPPDPCRDIGNLHAEAEEVCSVLTSKMGIRLIIVIL